AEIKWNKTGHDTYWAKFWLLGFTELARSYKNDDDCFISGMPGADLVIVSDEKEWWNTRVLKNSKRLLNYTSVPEDARSVLNEKILPRDIHLKTGVHTATFQPWAQITYIQQMGWDLGDKKEVSAIIPLSDLITMWLTGGEIHKHAPHMYKSQGLGAREILKILFPKFAYMIAPWQVIPLGQCYNGIYPMDHDSIFSRLIGFMLCPWVLWTGSWFGAARFMQGLSAIPSKKTFDAKIAFEGAGWTEAVITNTGMFGVVYKELLRRAGLKYTEVYEQTREIWEEALQFNLGALPKKVEEAADWIIKKCAIDKDERYVLYVAIVSFIKSVAKACADDFKNVAYALDLDMPTKVAITGGGAENELLKLALSELGIEVIVPYFARNATHAGLAAFGLSEGKGVWQFREAATMIEGWAKNSLNQSAF
ncbi:MAG: hypothetical protein CEO40_262, partial [Parcubacteria group bacterium LiPW_72]